jgi:hypothetical protein
MKKFVEPEYIRLGGNIRHLREKLICLNYSFLSLLNFQGQTFLRELANALDEMPVKRLVRSELITEPGEVCSIGAVCKKRNIDVKDVDIYDPEAVGKLVNISRAMAAEIEYENDERPDETPEKRWIRMRKWVDENLIKTGDQP